MGGGGRQLADRARGGRRRRPRSRPGTTRCTRSPTRSRRRSRPAARSCSSRARSCRSTPSCWPRSARPSACRPASSTWSPARARSSARRSSPTRETDMVSFTGSTRAGRRVSELAAQAVKPVSLELGGKSPNVILDDADLEQAVVDGVAKCFLNSGQTCSALTRMLVPRDKLEQAERIAAAVADEAFTPGDPFADGSALGPLVSEAQRERVRGYIEKGQAEGAKLVTGGAEPPEGLDSGYFVRPTVFSDVTPEMTIAQEEIFGPVLAIMPYDDEDDAVRIANDTIYGLAGGVWSADEERAKRVAARIRTGQVEINGGAFNPLAPFGGYKQSGPRPRAGPLRPRGVPRRQVAAALKNRLYSAVDFQPYAVPAPGRRLKGGPRSPPFLRLRPDMQTNPLQSDIEQRLASAEPEVELLACERVGAGAPAAVDRPSGRRQTWRCASGSPSTCATCSCDYGARGVLAGPAAAAHQAGSLPALPRPPRARAPARAARRPQELHRRARRRIRRRGDRGRRGRGGGDPVLRDQRSNLSWREERDDQGDRRGRGSPRAREGHLRRPPDGGARGRAPLGLQEDARGGQVRARGGGPRQRRLPRLRADPAARPRGAAARRGRGGARRADGRPGDRRAGLPRAARDRPGAADAVPRPDRRARRHAGRLRPHRRPDRQAGDPPAHPRGRAGHDVQRVPGPRRRADHRHRPAVRLALHARAAARARRGAAAARRAGARRALRPRRSASRRSSPTSRTRPRARRSSCRAARPS